MAKEQGIIIDLHAHTYYSNCSQDDPRDVINVAIENGVNVLGVNDHNYGIGERKEQYIAEMRAVASAYKGQITILCGIEIATFPHLFDIKSPKEIANFDYCLIEHITSRQSIVGGNLIEFCKSLGIPCGIAHTDLFEYCDMYGKNYAEFFTQMANSGIFWEMNVNYDSIHGYHEHEYVKEFVSNEQKQAIVKASGLCVSVGFDGHRYKDYDGSRVRAMNSFLQKNGISTLLSHPVLGKKIKNITL